MQKIESFLNKYIGPIATYMNNSLFFGSLTEAFMRTTPVTLGAAVILLIGNFPIPAYLDFLSNSGIATHFSAAQNATMNALSLYIVFNFSYVYAKKNNYEALSAGLLAVANFLLLAPQSYSIAQMSAVPTEFPTEATITGVTNLSAFATTYTGARGIIVAIIVGWLTGYLYVLFNKKNLVLKLPSSVPPNVSESLRPSILSGLILLIFIAIRMVFAFVPWLNNYGDIFTFIGDMIQAPLTSFVSSPLSVLVIFTIANILWFFGIHPSMIYGLVAPISQANLIDNQNAFQAGEPLPFLLYAVILFGISNGFGGQGTTIGLVISMFRAKSERYKQLFKLVSIPSLFNINEPLIFGMPIMMNPIFFIPMVIITPVTGGLAWFLSNVFNYTEHNPMMMLPWTTPAIVSSILMGGIKLFIIAIVIVVVSFIIWYPFFQIADARALKEEKESA